MAGGFDGLFDAECGEESAASRLGARFGTTSPHELSEHHQTAGHPPTMRPPASFDMARLLSQVTEENPPPNALPSTGEPPAMMEAAAFPAQFPPHFLPIDDPGFTPLGEAIDFHYANYTIPNLPLGPVDDWVHHHEASQWDDRLMRLSWHEAIAQSSANPALPDGVDVSFEEARNNIESYESISADFLFGQTQTGRAPFPTYEFEYPVPQNEFDPIWSMNEGFRALAAGDIPTAVYLLENSVRGDPNNAEAWYQLGTAQQLNENDKGATAALCQCLHIDPKHPFARLALAASFTNELRRADALVTLAEWSDLHLPDGESERIDRRQRWEALGDYGSYTFQHRLFGEAEARFLKILENSQSSEVISNAETALGILYNIGEEYEKAAQHFESAIFHRPDDALLYNRLGASLANGDRNAEAIAVYRRALELSPGLLRTRYNLGIASCNMNLYKEAAQHFLSVLNKQNETRSTFVGIPPPRLSGGLSRTGASASVWASLRMALLAMDRRDLYDLALDEKLSEINLAFPDHD